MIATLKHFGLPQGVKRSGFIELVAPALKARGVSTSAINYLSKAFENFTRDQDFEPNRVCGFWHKVSSLAKKLSITPRTVNSNERQLEQLQMIERTTMANGARSGCREDGDGAPLRWLRGINLSPIIELAPVLIAKVNALQLEQETVSHCKAEIRQINKRIRQLNDNDALAQSHEILPNGGTTIIHDIERLEAIRSALKAVENSISPPSGSEKTSDEQEENNPPIIQTKKSKPLYASHKVTPRQVMEIAMDEFTEYLEMYGDYSWRGIVEVAFQVSQIIGIDEHTWRAACASLGRERAALCIVVIHRNQGLPNGHPYRAKTPGACLRGMIRSAMSGRLNLIGFIGAAKSRPPQETLFLSEGCHAS